MMHVRACRAVTTQGAGRGTSRRVGGRSAGCARMLAVGVDLLYLRDAYLSAFTAAVTAVDGQRVALDRTAFYPTGGGQPHDTGRLGGAQVVDVRKEGDVVWHTVDGPVAGVRVVKTESKGKGNKRIRIEVLDG